MADIPHYPDLVERFEQDHRVLLKAYGRVRHGAQARDAVEFKAALQEFQSLLVPHLVAEGYKLYTYLRQRTRSSGDHATYDKVNQYKSEMAHIGDAALHFIETYLKMPDGEIDFALVEDELRQIGLALGDRIHREESELYQLYETTR